MIERYRADVVVPVDDAGSLHSPGIVDVEGGRILWVGPAASAPARPEAVVRVLAGMLLPGFVNTHAHSPMVLLRAAGEGLPVGRWLTEVMWPREGKLTPDDVRVGMTLGAAELLTNGITTSHEMYFYPREAAEAAVAVGLRIVVTPPVLVADDLARFGSWESQIEAVSAEARRWTGHELVTVGFGPHSAYTLPEEPLERIAAAAAAEGLHVHIHVAEQRHEGDAISARHGLTVPRFLDSIGMLDVPVVAAHSVWLTDDDIELFAARGVGVAHCPASNTKHASGVAPVVRLREAGVAVGIATDGPASHDRLDPFEEMRLAVRLARVTAGDAAALGPVDALRMTTREAAAVLGRDDIGSLVPGRRADMILVDTGPFVPVVEPDDILAHLVYSGAPSLVRDVWVEGRQVVGNGRVMSVDVAEARRDVTTRARRLAGG